MDLGCLGVGVGDGTVAAKVEPRLMNVAECGAAGEEEWHRASSGRLGMVL